ncbi:MAG: ribonuclease III [Xanthomonadaceae bacterium]|nr:ribonuclease III [Xanthomonadaceae bacterium]
MLPTTDLGSLLQILEGKIGYQFGERKILVQSLTHTSYGHENNVPDNERLEFLGDAILDVIISDLLLETFPEATEGQLTKMRAGLVNEVALFELTKQLELGKYLRLGKGETLTGGSTKPSILSSTFEALIAAIYIDGGFHAVYPVVRHLFAPYLNFNTPNSQLRDFKSKLQEKTQALLKLTPQYILVSTQGPDHTKTFEIEVRLDSQVLGRAFGLSKKQAEQNAAQLALELLENGPTFK